MLTRIGLPNSLIWFMMRHAYSASSSEANSQKPKLWCVWEMRSLGRWTFTRAGRAGEGAAVSGHALTRGSWTEVVGAHRRGQPGGGVDERARGSARPPGSPKGSAGRARGRTWSMSSQIRVSVHRSSRLPCRQAEREGERGKLQLMASGQRARAVSRQTDGEGARAGTDEVDGRLLVAVRLVGGARHGCGRGRAG